MLMCSYAMKSYGATCLLFQKGKKAAVVVTPLAEAPSKRRAAAPSPAKTKTPKKAKPAAKGIVTLNM